MQYKNSSATIAAIAAQLGVGTILEGSVRRIGSRARVTAQLIDAATDRQFWAESYDRDLTDVFAIQTDIAERIAASLNAELSSGEQGQLRSQQHRDPEAYNLYLRGRHLLHRWTAEGWQKGIESIRAALVRDPHFAPGHAAIALAYAQSGYFGVVPPEQSFPLARAAATEAIRIDPSTGDAHAALGLVQYWFDWDWNAAADSLQRAVQLDPGHSFAHTTYGMLLDSLKRSDEAMRERMIAFDLDPLDPLTGGNVAFGHYFSRRFDAAIAQFKSTLDLDPTAGVALIGLGMALVQAGRFTDALAAFRNSVQVTGESRTMLGHLAYTHALAGDNAEACRILDELIRLSSQRYVPAYNVAVVYAGLRRDSEMFDWLERAYAEHVPWMVWVNVAPEFDPWRDDARFIALRKKMRLP